VGSCPGIVALAVVVGPGGDPAVGLIVAGVVLVVVGTAFYFVPRRARTSSKGRSKSRR
jgi:hypothetical protein